MIVDMKFDEASLTRYLSKNLEPLTEADPLILAKYVAALLKKDKPIKELQKLCAENLVEFLGPGTNSFVGNLFEALESGSIVSTAKNLDSVEEVEPSSSLATVRPIELNKSSLKTDELSPSGQLSDSEEKEISDDDDDDRNHKHRRRENRSQSFEKDVQEHSFRRQSRKRNRPFDNGHMFLESDPQSSGNHKGYNPTPLGTDQSAKRRLGMTPLPRAHFDLSQRNRVNQGIHGEGGSRLDLSTPLGRLPIGRGRGRTSGLWSQHDSRFTSVGTLEFAPQMAPQGPTPSLFAGRGLQNAATTPNASWSAFGLIPGMPNGGLDALHPLMQGTLRPSINPPLGIGIPRQRCRDFEERGFCLRGDMCPMEHGVNRIVVEDVQSLSQFNLPVSLPSARLLGKPAGSGPLPTGSGPSSLSTSSKGLHGKSSMAGANGDGLGMNGMLSVSASGEADLYDPDQPLWNNSCPEASHSLLRLSSPKIDDVEPIWNADPSDRQNFRLSDGNGSDFSGRNITTAVGSQGMNSSVWGRIGNSGNKVEATGKNDCTAASMDYLGNETQEDQVEGLPGGSSNVHKKKWTVSEDVVPKAKISAATSRLQNDSARITERTPQKAQRTLFVNGIPLKSNKKETLLSHFQKFGEVIDIYIPLNSERAFVQFSTREEAESALKAPDAVMGNRFIKLWWANRDSIPENGVSSGKTASAGSHGLTAASFPQSSSADRGKEILPSLEKVSAVSAPETSGPSAVNVRHVVTNGPKDIPSQKKLENLELLKEELRLKQQMLDQKRIDFKRQLDKLQKQAVTVKGEGTPQQVDKKHKVETDTDIAKSATPKSSNSGKAGVRTEVEKMRDRNSFGENLASPSSKTNLTAVLQPARSSTPLSHSSASVVSPFLVNRFKLDNRPTTFRILPPLPADLANVAVLKEHFSSFGDLPTVELEDAEGDTSSIRTEPSENCSARITFTTRRSAERAFSSGKCWRGHNLQFLWLTASSNSSNNIGRENSPTLAVKGLPDAEVLTKTAESGSSTPSTVKSTRSESEAAATAGNEESVNSEEMKQDVKPMVLVEARGTSPTTMSSCVTQSPKAHNVIHEDGPNVEFSS